MKTSRVILLCVLSGAAFWFLGTITKADPESRHRSNRFDGARLDASELSEIRDELRKLRRLVESSLQSRGSSEPGNMFSLVKDAIASSRADDARQRSETEAATEEVRTRALVRIDEKIAAQKRVSTRAVIVASHSKRAEDMELSMTEHIRSRALERRRELISQSQSIDYLRETLDAE